MSTWRDEYDVAANEESARWRRATDQQLWHAIESGNTGEYFAIWREAARRPRSRDFYWLLFSVLLSQREFLERYHCATALLELLGCRSFEAVELSASWPTVPANLEKLRALVKSTVGHQPQSGAIVDRDAGV